MKGRLNMENKVKSKKGSLSRLLNLLMPIFFIVLGILMIANPSLMQTIFLIICILILEGCLIELVIYFAVRPYEKKPRHLRSGIALGVIGTALILIYYFMKSLIPFCIGIILCISGVGGMIKTFRRKDAHYPWQASTAINALIVLMGIVVLIFTFFTSWIWILAGILMIISGLLRLINSFLIANAGARPSPDYVDVTEYRIKETKAEPSAEEE